MKTLSTLGTMLAIVVLCAPSASAQNLLSNPGFESGYADYFTFGNPPVISDASNDNIFLSGAAASKIFGAGTGCPFPTFDVNGFGQFVTPTAGKIYTFSGSSFVSSADGLVETGGNLCDSNRAIAKLVFFDAASGGNEIAATEVSIGDYNTTVDQWNSFSISLPAPSNALRVEALIIFLQPGCDTGAVFTDDLSLVATDAPTAGTNLLTNPDFSDGVAVGWTPFGNVIDEPNGSLHRSAGGVAAMFGTFVEGADTGINQFILVTPGTDYELSAWTLSECSDAITGQNANLVLGIIQFRGAGDVPIGEPISATFLDNTNDLGNWTQGSLTATAPAGAVSAEVLVLFEQVNVTEGGKAFVDDVFFGEADATDAPSANRGFVLEQNNPNPFNPKTTIRFALDRAGDVSLRIFDAKGRLVNVLADRGFDAGAHALTWNGRSADGQSVASGIYHYVLDTAAGREARSMVLLK